MQPTREEQLDIIHSQWNVFIPSNWSHIQVFENLDVAPSVSNREILKAETTLWHLVQLQKGVSQVQAFRQKLNCWLKEVLTRQFNKSEVSEDILTWFSRKKKSWIFFNGILHQEIKFQLNKKCHHQILYSETVVELSEGEGWLWSTQRPAFHTHFPLFSHYDFTLSHKNLLLFPSHWVIYGK